MRASPRKRENQLRLVFQIDEKPVRLNMQLPEVLPAALERMILVPRGNCCSRKQDGDDFIEFGDIAPLLLNPPAVFFECA